MAKSLDTPHLNDVIYKYMHNNVYKSISKTSFYVSLFGVIVLAGAFASNLMPSASADSSTTATATVRVSSACSLSATVDTAHNATLLNGIYSGSSDYPNGIGQTTLTAFCNDTSGFAIYAVGFSGDEYGATDMLGNNTSATIPTGTATSGDTSQWAMKLAKVTDNTAYTPANLTITNSFDSYHAVPSDYAKVASFSSSTDQTLGSKFTLTYAAFVSATQAADTYTGKVKYTMVHPASAAAPEVPVEPVDCAGGKICYSPGPSSVTDSMGDQQYIGLSTSGVIENTTPISNSGEAVLWASNFKRDGYGFAGWTDKHDWALGANDASGNGTGANAGHHIYGPNATITLPSDVETNGLSLYAVWVPSAGNLQNWNGCSSMNIGDVTALTDLRDNDTYAVAKLADGKCWMIENLRLDYNADFTESLSQGFGKSTAYGNFIGLAMPETANFRDTVTANSIYYSGTQSGTATINISNTNATYYPGYRIPRYRNDNTNKDSTTNPNTNIANMTKTTQAVYSYGNYYTWHAAMANTIFYDNALYTDSDGKTSETVNTSLCPAGWRLPRGGYKSREATNDFWALIVTGINNGNNPANYDSSDSPSYGSGDPKGSSTSIALRAYPNNFLFSGAADDSSITNRGYNGNYWSSTAGRNSSHRLEISNTSVYPATSINLKYLGFSIRCLAGS